MMKKRKLIFVLLIVMLSGCGAANHDQPAIQKLTMTPSSTLDQVADSETADPYGNQVTWDGDSGNFPLYAMIKSEEIYLYGVKPYGMILYQNEKGTYFEWPGLTPRSVLPQMMYHDFDGNGERELAVLLYVASGTGYSIMDLHVLTIEGDRNDWAKLIYTDHALVGDAAKEWMTERITIETADDEEFVVEFCGKSYVVNNPFNPEDGAVTGICYEDIVSFSFDGTRIRTKIVVGAFCENSATARFFGEIEAYVVFAGDGFKLEEYTFTSY